MEAKAHKQPSGRPERVNILLVDDQPARLLSYETILAELDQNLISARSGVEALAKLMKDDFALVLLDVSMPGMDGFETAAMIHDHPRFERTPIIFVTGVHDTEFDRLKDYKLGAVDYVSIPVVPEILRSKVSVLVELHCQIERGLPADRRQQRVGALLVDDPLERVGGERLDVGAIGELGVGHDGGGVAVDQHHLQPLALERLERLRAGIVELAGLADDDRARSDDEYPMDVSPFRHPSATLHGFDELREQVIRVVRTRRRFGMVLY